MSRGLQLFEVRHIEDKHRRSGLALSSLSRSNPADYLQRVIHSIVLRSDQQSCITATEKTASRGHAGDSEFSLNQFPQRLLGNFVTKDYDH
jgi:hypothetical protein